MVEGLDVAFLVFQQLVGIGILRCDPEAPGLVTMWILVGDYVVSDRYRDLDCGILEEESI